MGRFWITSKALRSIQHPSSRLVVLLFTLVLGMWIGSSFNDHHPASSQLQSVSNSIAEADAEQKDSIFMVVLILTAKHHTVRRDACRTTWLRLAAERPVRHFFVIGGLEVSSVEMSKLSQENETHGDLIIFNDITDSYSGLTQKLLAAIQHMDLRFQFNFLLKVDDDSFARLDALFDELADMEDKRSLYWGYFSGGAPVKRAGLWKESEWFLCDKYVPYAVGGGYVLSSDLVHHISASSSLLQLYASEDVTLGTWLSPLRINRRHDVRFDTWYKSRGCANSFLVTHKQTPGLMKDKYEALEKIGYLCKKEKFVQGYIYDWTALPSQCCTQRELHL